MKSLDALGGFEVFEEREVRVETAARAVVALCREDRFGQGWRPKGLDEVAILLESLGYSAEVVSGLWYDSLFDFAADVNRYVEKYIADMEPAQEPDLHWFTTACKDYVIGSLYAGPWIVSVLGLAICGASLWSSLSMPLHLATVIALGMYASLPISGAFAQPLARRLMFYFLQENARLMAWIMDRFLMGAAVVTLVSASIGVWILRPIYGKGDALLAAAFFIGAVFFQISLAPLYTLRRFGWILCIALVASALTGLTFLLWFHRRVTFAWQPEILAVEVGGVGLLATAAMILVMHGRARRCGSVARPALRAVIESCAPYAAFGACYFLAIVVDHFAAGCARGGRFVYRSGYELGTDIGLLATVPIVGAINVALEAVPRRILAGAGFGIAKSELFNRDMTRFYLRGIGAVLAVALFAGGGTELLGRFLLAHTRLGLHGTAGAEAVFVLRFAVIGDGLLMLGLLNAQFLFFLSRPYPVLWASLLAFCMNASWGLIVCMRHLPAAWCVFGLDAAATAFALLTTVRALRAARAFTYTYYAAY